MTAIKQIAIVNRHSPDSKHWHLQSGEHYPNEEVAASSLKDKGYTHWRINGGYLPLNTVVGLEVEIPSIGASTITKDEYEAREDYSCPCCGSAYDCQHETEAKPVSDPF